MLRNISNQKIIKQVQLFSQLFLPKFCEFDERLELQIDNKWKKARENECSQKEILSSNGLCQSQFYITQPCDNANFYDIVMMVFPEISSKNPLDIEIADTLFYLQDNSIIYVFNDSKKGLLKIRNKNVNVTDLFLKRKFLRKKSEEKYFNDKRGEISTTFSLTLSQKTDKKIKESAANLGYIGLLKYKDNSFLRIKENQFKAIFHNPLHANERFKNINNTQYIQKLPHDLCDPIHQKVCFTLQKFKNQPLFKLALEMVVSENEYNKTNKKNQIKNAIKESNIVVFLHFLVFKIHAYVLIHYGKRIERGNFYFIILDEGCILYNIDAILIIKHDIQYKRIGLFQIQKKVKFQNRKTKTQNCFFHEKVENRTQFNKQIDNFFQKTNDNIKKDVTNFVNEKIDKIKAAKDKNVSKSIFDILHPNSEDFYQILNNEDKMKKLLNLNGIHHLKNNINERQLKGKFTKQIIKQQRKKENIEIKLHKETKQKYIYRGIQTTD